MCLFIPDNNRRQISPRVDEDLVNAWKFVIEQEEGKSRTFQSEYVEDAVKLQVSLKALENPQYIKRLGEEGFTPVAYIGEALDEYGDFLGLDSELDEDILAVYDSLGSDDIDEAWDYIHSEYSAQDSEHYILGALVTGLRSDTVDLSDQWFKQD